MNDIINYESQAVDHHGHIARRTIEYLDFAHVMVLRLFEEDDRFYLIFRSMDFSSYVKPIASFMQQIEERSMQVESPPGDYVLYRYWITDPENVLVSQWDGAGDLIERTPLNQWI